MRMKKMTSIIMILIVELYTVGLIFENEFRSFIFDKKLELKEKDKTIKNKETKQTIRKALCFLSFRSNINLQQRDIKFIANIIKNIIKAMGPITSSCQKS